MADSRKDTQQIQKNVNMNKAAKIISGAVLGTDPVVFLVNSKRYVVQPPTIHKLSGAISCLSMADLQEQATIKDILLALKDTPELCAKALSWFINGNEALYPDLIHGTFDEIVNGLEKSISLISTSVFLKAVSLAKNVASLAAKPK